MCTNNNKRWYFVLYIAGFIYNFNIVTYKYIHTCTSYVKYTWYNLQLQKKQHVKQK